MVLLSFILPPESGERIGLGITVLMAMAIFQELTSNKLPADSNYIPLLGKRLRLTAAGLSKEGVLDVNTATATRSSKEQSVFVGKTSLHGHHAFLYLSLPSLHDYDVNCLISLFIDNVNIRRRIFLSLYKLEYSS